MKISLILMCAAVLLCFSADAEANPDLPGLWGINPGTYSTHAGTVLPGRMSESWIGDPPDFYVPGNVTSIMSWDGDSLGSQWRVWGVEVDSEGAVMQTYAVDEAGFGFIDYAINCTGGSIWFDNEYFGDGSIGLGGWITYMNTGVRFSYVANNIVGITSNILISGVFKNCPGCVFQFAIMNAMNIWKPGDPDPAPEGYPEFSSGVETGSLWDLVAIVMDISCHSCDINEPYCNQIGVEESSWGKIKKIHR